MFLTITLKNKCYLYRYNYPRLLMQLKDSIIVSIACGHTHTLAITINQNVIAWGNNK